uniref:Reverse transcriptase domain-containing protein n=1 Tax=Tanacetum cinerariifolium TaxID=118510 RepID=A0A6L2JGI9_TANCI|nr:reverse transcriptase domain-containing protein [Tanacetum cinerariifolium]
MEILLVPTSNKLMVTLTKPGRMTKPYSSRRFIADCFKLEGMFLGYMISLEGIKTCPDKTKVVLRFPSPRTIKEVQSLNGKLARLNRFLSKSAEKSLPLFKTLKKEITKVEHHAGRTQYHVLAKEICERTDPSGFLCRKAERSSTRYVSAGLILTSPEGTKFTYALRFLFTASNNEAEYEALIAGLRIATQMGVRNVHVSVDSNLMANQVLGTYVAKEENMIKYLEKAKSLEVVTIVEEDGPTWMTPIMEYLKDGTFPDDRKEGIDIAGPFPEGPGKVKFLIVAMDYFTKWIEAKAAATITGSQSNRLVERENRSLGKGIKARLGVGNKNWIEELHHVLWAYRMMIKSSHGDTPFSLTYGTEAVIPVEIRIPTYRTAIVDVMHNDEELWLNLDLLEERRERAAICKAKAKLKMTKYYNARARGVTFRPRDFVYRSNDASHAVDGGKLGPK